MQNHNDDTIKTSGHRSLGKYSSYFVWKGSKGLLKVLLCERWVGGWTELQHIDPHYYDHNSVCFPFSWTAQPGDWGPGLSGTWSSFQHLLSNWLTSCLHPGYIIVRHPPSSCGAGSLNRILSPTDWTSCAPSYIIIWRPLFLLGVSQFRTQFNPSTVKVISWYSSPKCTCYLHRCISYFDSLAGVNMLHWDIVYKTFHFSISNLNFQISSQYDNLFKSGLFFYTVFWQIG